jgi:tryptophan-rich sensory protein
MLLARTIVRKLSWIDRIVGVVWIALSGLMLAALYLLYVKSGFSEGSLLVILLLVATWTYPFYTLGFRLIPGLFGNLFYAGLLGFGLVRVYGEIPLAAWLLVPIGVWIAIATVYVIAQIAVRSEASG